MKKNYYKLVSSDLDLFNLTHIELTYSKIDLDNKVWNQLTHGSIFLND